MKMKRNQTCDRSQRSKPDGLEHQRSRPAGSEDGCESKADRGEATRVRVCLNMRNHRMSGVGSHGPNCPYRKLGELVGSNLDVKIDDPIRAGCDHCFGHAGHDGLLETFDCLFLGGDGM